MAAILKFSLAWKGASTDGLRAFPICVACDAHASKAVIYCPNHDAKPRQFQRSRW